jgi:hypothetical protein
MRGIEALSALLPARPSRHESFLVFSRFRYLRLAALLAALALALYLADRPYGSHYGGSAVGYTLGTAGALLIVWLTWFGYRKRRYAEGSRALVGRLSAHVYFGLALLVIATLHTGLHFGWNVHTLAYGLMCVVIASGLFGVFCYVRFPELITKNRGGMTMRQMLGSIATLDEQLRVAALPLDEATAAVIERAIETSAIGGSVLRQLSGRYPDCTTAAALAHFQADGVEVPPELEDAWRQVHVLLDEKMALLGRVRRDISYKAMMDLWLYLHVPLTFMLLVALLAHIFSVFFLW